MKRCALACRSREFYDALVQLSRPKWFAVLVCLLIVLSVLFSTRSRSDLLSKASRLAPAQGVITNELTYSGYNFFYHHVPSYFWLSDSELFSIHEIRRRSYETVRIDLTTGNVAREPGCGPIGRGEGMRDKFFYWTVSPDGKWILSISKVRDDLAYTAKRFNATRQVVWTNHFEGGVQPAWLNDSSGFVEWPVRDGVDYARIHWLDTGKVNEINFDALHAESPKGKASFITPYAAVAAKMWRDGSAAEFIELKREGDSVNAKRYTLQPPVELAGGEGRAFPSPRGDRLAWVAYFKRKIPGVSFQRHDPYFNVDPVYSVVVCLSRPDGSGVRVLGRLPPGHEISRLAWTTDATHLSFICDSALWTVSVD